MKKPLVLIVYVILVHKKLKITELVIPVQSADSVPILSTELDAIATGMQATAELSCG